jgi:hypothetical protein
VKVDCTISFPLFLSLRMTEHAQLEIGATRNPSATRLVGQVVSDRVGGISQIIRMNCSVCFSSIETERFIEAHISTPVTRKVAAAIAEKQRMAGWSRGRMG